MSRLRLQIEKAKKNQERRKARKKHMKGELEVYEGDETGVSLAYSTSRDDRADRTETPMWSMWNGGAYQGEPHVSKVSSFHRSFTSGDYAYCPDAWRVWNAICDGGDDAGGECPDELQNSDRDGCSAAMRQGPK